MDFCDNCGALLKSMGNKMVCSCGHDSSSKKSIIVEKAKKKDELKVLYDETNPLAVYDHICSKCGYGKAQLATKGIQYSDEDEGTEFVCGRCGHHDMSDGIRTK